MQSKKVKANTARPLQSRPKSHTKSVQSCPIGLSWVIGPAETQTAGVGHFLPTEVEHLWTERGGTVSHQASSEKSVYYLTNFHRYHKSTSVDKTTINGKMWGRSRQGPPRHSHQGSGYQCSKGSLAKKVQPNWRVTGRRASTDPKGRQENASQVRCQGSGTGQRTEDWIIPGSCSLYSLCCLYFVH